MPAEKPAHLRAVEVARQIVNTEREIADIERRLVAARNNAAPPKAIIDIRKQLADAKAEADELQLQLEFWRAEAQRDEQRMQRLAAREHLDDAFEHIDTWANEVAEVEAAMHALAAKYMTLRQHRPAVLAALKAAGVPQSVLGLVLDDAAVDGHLGNALRPLRSHVAWYRPSDGFNPNTTGEDAVRRFEVALNAWLQPLMRELDMVEAEEARRDVLTAEVGE